MDCAVKFEKSVAALPGVTRVSFNTMIGKLKVEGAVSLEAIRGEGRKENYNVFPDHESLAGPVKPRINWEPIRVATALVALLAGYIAEWITVSSAVYIPMYVAAIAIGGWGNFRKAFYSLSRLDFNMSVLMSMAILGAMAIGHWEEGAVVAFLYAISEMLEVWTMDRARHAIDRLMHIAPKAARISRPDGEVDVPVEEIMVGDLMIIRPGEKIAMDGRIIKGESAINQASITGESAPVEKGIGAEVYAGTLNISGSLEVEVTKHVQDTTIAKIINLVEEAQSKRAPAQAFVERFAAIYTPIVLVLALGIILAPSLFLGYDWEPWFYRGLALLVVSCPCALVVSTPVAIVSAISNAARQGVLIKGGIYLEEAGTIQAIAFDKTGTLTKGVPAVTDIIPARTCSEQKLLQIAAALETRSEHPLAEAIIKAAKARHLAWSPAEDFSNIAGRGAQGTINEQKIYIGNPCLFKSLGIKSNLIDEQVALLQKEGKTVMLVGTRQGFLGLIAVADEVRETTKASLAALRRLGIKHTIMLTGDNEATAQAMSERAGVDEYRAELLPQDKVTAIETYQEKYGKVAMVGDGVNDTPALATANIGIAMGGAGTDIALETADIALMADDLTKLPFTIRLSRATLRIIRQNIAFALAIKTIAVLAVFPGWLTLWLAILGDMGATVLVTLNSIRLMRLKPGD